MQLSKTLPLLLIISLIYSCSSNKEKTQSESIKVELDSTWHVMNPMDLEFDTNEQAMIDSGMANMISDYRSIREYGLPNSTPPALQFNPLPMGFTLPESTATIDWEIPEGVTKPLHGADLAFMSIPELASLLRSGEISCLGLTEFYIGRLKKYNPELHCVITLTEEYALERAKELDAELSAGTDRGILHGIPYGAKDLFAFPGYPTTWGATPYKEQVLDKTAGIIEQLEEAGAVLVAKTTLGALAMGDVWFADTTRNPWNLEQGSSGSSAGSASATAAGLLPFAIGSETWGSIVSPATRCGVTGLRPTYGRVSRYGAMELSWSMDKVGPLCRSASDCAIVFDAIRGEDPRDPTLLKAGFSYPEEVDLGELKIGYFKEAFQEEGPSAKFDRKTLKKLEKMGAQLQPVDLDISTIPVEALGFILTAEAAAAFDDLTRSNQDSLLVQQHIYAWPNLFRSARYITAVEYIQANRIRTDLVEAMHARMKDFDVVILPSFAGQVLLTGNLTGQPVVVLPNGFSAGGTPSSISFMGNLFDEGTVLAVAAAYQEATDYHLKRPLLFNGN